MRDPATTISKLLHSKFKSIGSSNKSFPVKKFPTYSKEISSIYENDLAINIGNVLVLKRYDVYDCNEKFICIAIISFGLGLGFMNGCVHMTKLCKAKMQLTIQLSGKKKTILFI